MLLKAISPFKNYNVKDSIIISTETRSGSTWLMEMLNSTSSSIINWEPLHEKKGLIPKSLNWGERPIIAEDNTESVTFELMDKILSFKIFSKNSIRFCTFKDIFTSTYVVTKMVRSNLLLPWIVNNFNFKYKPIYLLRHPIAVAKSQERNITLDNQFSFPSFEIPDTLNNERYEENFDYIKGLSSGLERRVALWCLHNMEIINHPENGKKWIMVYYENLVLDPAKGLQSISDKTGITIPIDIIKFEKPSASDFKGEYERDKLVQLSRWKNGLSDEDLDSIQKIFDHYGLEEYSAHNTLPLNEKI